LLCFLLVRLLSTTATPREGGYQLWCKVSTQPQDSMRLTSMPLQIHQRSEHAVQQHSPLHLEAHHEVHLRSPPPSLEGRHKAHLRSPRSLEGRHVV